MFHTILTKSFTDKVLKYCGLVSIENVLSLYHCQFQNGYSSLKRLGRYFEVQNGMFSEFFNQFLYV